MVRRHAAPASNAPSIEVAEHRVLGLDASLSCSGYAYWKQGRLVTGRIKTDHLRGAHRLFYVRMQLAKLLDECDPTLVAMEDYALGAGGKHNNNVFHIGELGGVLKILVWDRGVDLLSIPPTVMKSVIALHGRAEKPQIVEALERRFGLVVRQHDEADATGLLLVGEMKCGLRPYDPPYVEGKKTVDRSASVRACEVVKGRPQRLV